MTDADLKCVGCGEQGGDVSRRTIGRQTLVLCDPCEASDETVRGLLNEEPDFDDRD